MKESIKLYRQLMKRNREVEILILKLEAEQKLNGQKALRLVSKYPEVQKLHKRRYKLGLITSPERAT